MKNEKIMSILKINDEEKYLQLSSTKQNLNLVLLIYEDSEKNYTQLATEAKTYHFNNHSSPLSLNSALVFHRSNDFKLKKIFGILNGTRVDITKDAQKFKLLMVLGERVIFVSYNNAFSDDFTELMTTSHSQSENLLPFLLDSMCEISPEILPILANSNIIIGKEGVQNEKIE